MTYAPMESYVPTKSCERRFRGNTGTGIDAYNETPVTSLAKAWKRRNVDGNKDSLKKRYEYFIKQPIKVKCSNDFSRATIRLSEIIRMFKEKILIVIDYES